MTGPQHPIPTAKGRAYVAWRDAPDRDHTEDDEPIVAFSAGWDAREEAEPSVQPPTREQVAEAQAAVEAIARCPILSAQSGEPPEITYDVRVLSERIEAARTAVLALFPQSTGDEYHTLDELYEYRMLYNALAANGWATHGTYPVVKSWRHSDGEECFGGGWFIVVATLPTGQVANHYKAEFWDLFTVPEVETPPEYDGHTPAEAARRMHAMLQQPAPSAEPGAFEWCHLCGAVLDGTRDDRRVHRHMFEGLRPPEDDGPAEPVSIADMALGTQFGYPTRWEVGERGPASGRVIVHRVGTGDTRYLDDFDPSTIREVTPLPATPEEG